VLSDEFTEHKDGMTEPSDRSAEHLSFCAATAVAAQKDRYLPLFSRNCEGVRA